MSTSSARKIFLYAAWLVAPTSLVFAAVACTANLSSARSLASTPTSARFFGYAEIIKPTYTPSPTATPTQTPEPTAQVEIIANTSAPVLQNGESIAPSYGGNKYVLVDISEQRMYVYENDALVYSFVASTGMNNATRAGTFSVLDKIPNAYGATWNIWMPNWLGIYWAGSLENGIHALPILSNGATLWSGYLGVPISYGCVVLGTYEAQVLYDWAEIGATVKIQW